MKRSGGRTIGLSRPDVGEREIKYVTEVLRTPYLSLGPMLRRFEAALARYVGSRYAIAVSNGTSGLHLCVHALAIGEGDEVITTPFSFVASANCLLYERAVPVFVDIDPRTLNLDVGQIEAKITNRTKAILPVHVFGLSCAIDEVLTIAATHGLRVVEDACEAIGATSRGKKVGSFGDCGVFAFYPNKQMTTGEGGAIVTDSAEIATVCRSLRDQGRGADRGWFVHERLGYNYRLSELQCALGCAQLERIGELLAKRARVASLYASLLNDVEDVILPSVPTEGTRSWFVYVVLLKEGFSRDQRDAVLRGLKGRGVGCRNYFPPIHLQPFYASKFGYQRGDFPVAEAVSDRTIALPFHGNLAAEDVSYVVEALRAELEAAQTAAHSAPGRAAS